MFKLELYIVHEQLDFTKFDQKPTKPFVNKLGQFQILDNLMGNFRYNLQPNYISTHDDWLQLLEPYEWPSSFLSIESSEKNILRTKMNGDFKIYQQYQFALGSEAKYHQRTIYSLLDLFGDLGGLIEACMTLIAVFLHPWSEFVFNVKAIQKLYMVKYGERPQQSGFRRSNSRKYSDKQQKTNERLQSQTDKQKAMEL